MFPFDLVCLLFMLFLVDGSSVGQSKAECVCTFLQELNDAVKSKFIEEYPEALINTNPSFFSQFTLVIATQVYFRINYRGIKLFYGNKGSKIQFSRL